jgi:hypothetical protein
MLKVRLMQNGFGLSDLAKEEALYPWRAIESAGKQFPGHAQTFSGGAAINAGRP